MKLILRYLKKYRGLVFLNFLAILSFALVELGIPTIVAAMIDQGIAKNDIAYIQKMGVVILLISCVGGLGGILLTYCSSRISTAITRDLRNDIFHKAQQFTHEDYRRFGVSSMITRTTNDAFMILQFVNILLRTALLAPTMMVISMVLTFRTSPTLSGIIALTIPIILIGVVALAKSSQPLSALQQKLMDKLNQVSRENITGIRVIRAFCNDRHEQKRFDATNESYAAVAKKLYRLMAIAQPGFFFLLNLSVIAVVWISSQMIDVGTLQVGQLVAFLEYQFHAMFSLMIFCMVFIMYPRAQVSANRIMELLEAAPNIMNPEKTLPAPDRKGFVEFDHVSFSYPDGEEDVIKDVTFSAGPGETVAFIGSTGSGKSTLINLIPRFYDVTNGAIRVDGVDIRAYDLHALREKIGLVSQKAVLFSGTIADNIRYGKQDATEAELEHAAGVAQATDFITTKPEGFAEWVSESGSNLSGGQKQRLSIARAVVRKPEIYIFDDSFSALDFKTDAALRARLDQETGNAVVFIVAQRVSSILDASQIIVLDEGRVVGRGTHRELLVGCPIYHEIAASQMTKEELGE